MVRPPVLGSFFYLESKIYRWLLPESSIHHFYYHYFLSEAILKQRSVNVVDREIHTMNLGKMKFFFGKSMLLLCNNLNESVQFSLLYSHSLYEKYFFCCQLYYIPKDLIQLKTTSRKLYRYFGLVLLYF